MNYQESTNVNTKLDELNLRLTALEDNLTNPNLNTMTIGFNYSDITGTNYIKPASLRPGYPTKLIHALNMNEMTKIVLQAHVFDNDQKITELTIRYGLECVMTDGTRFDNILTDVDLMTKKIGTSPHTENYFMINETFYVKDYVPNYKDVKLLFVKIKRTSASSYGNESVLSVMKISPTKH